MTITIPLFALREARTSGVEYAILNLMKGLAATGSDLCVARSNPKHLAKNVRDWVDANRIPASDYPALGKSMGARFAEEAIFSLLARADRVIFPNYNMPFMAPRIRHRSVFLNDVQHRVFPQFFSRKKIAWMDFSIRHALAKADRMLFISAFELEQTKRFYGDEFAERAKVVHVAIDWHRFERGETRNGWLDEGHRPFILSVSQQYPHKRLDVLIRAFGILGRRQRDVALVLVGRQAAGLVERALSEIDEDVARRITFTGFVSDAELGHLYRQATLFALPSIYEGFGMPAVEALSFGKPALLVDATAVPEATMGLARYLPPSAGAAEWAAELEDMLLAPPVVGNEQARALRERYDPVTVAGRVRSALGV